MAIHEVLRTGPSSPRRTYSGPPVETVASCAKPDLPEPQSQSLSRSYGSNLPTSLTYIILSTRGCSPWRPAADMGTSWRESAVTSLGFSRSHRALVDVARTATLFAKTPKPQNPMRWFRFEVDILDDDLYQSESDLRTGQNRWIDKRNVQKLINLITLMSDNEYYIEWQRIFW